jgi:hypothetical protein
MGASNSMDKVMSMDASNSLDNGHSPSTTMTPATAEGQPMKMLKIWA